MIGITGLIHPRRYCTMVTARDAVYGRRREAEWKPRISRTPSHTAGGPQASGVQIRSSPKAVRNSEDIIES
jgi:hypothetical protein